MTALFSLKPDAVECLRSGTKQAILEALAARFAVSYGLDAVDVLERLEEREKLGSTGFGRNVAIPHARIEGLQRPAVVVLRLEEPVDFKSSDGLPVDVVFGLLSPESSGVGHLHALAAISRMVRDEKMHEALSDAPNAEAIYSLLTNATDRDAA